MAQKFIGVTLPIRLGQTGMFDQSTTVIQQVRSNFKNLILTKKGERVGQPELGCDLWKVLFEPMDDNILEAARLAVVNAVDRWLPYIELIKFNVTKSDDFNILNISCMYRFKSNANVIDQVTISTNELGLPTENYRGEPTTTEGINQFANEVQQARRLRRI